jgi:hypothetical protein
VCLPAPTLAHDRLVPGGDAAFRCTDLSRLLCFALVHRDDGPAVVDPLPPGLIFAALALAYQHRELGMQCFRSVEGEIDADQFAR